MLLDVTALWQRSASDQIALPVVRVPRVLYHCTPLSSTGEMSNTRVAVFDNVVAVGRHPSPFSLPLRSLARTNTTLRVRLHLPKALFRDPIFQRSHNRTLYRSTRLAASSDPEPSTEDSLLKDFDTDKLLKDAQEKWEKVEDKTSLVVYVVGTVLLLFVGSSVVSAFDRLPLLPKLFQLVGLIYTSWFVYRSHPNSHSWSC